MLNKVFAVPVDEKVALITIILQGANCGACGYPNVMALPKLLPGAGAITGCPPGGSKDSAALAEIMGVSASCIRTKVARGICRAPMNRWYPAMNIVVLRCARRLPSLAVLNFVSIPASAWRLRECL